MNTKYLLLIIFVLFPITVNATLLGRVNAYYSLKTSEEVVTAIEKHGRALEEFEKADKKIAAAKTAVADAKTAVADAKAAVADAKADVATAIADAAKAAIARTRVMAASGTDAEVLEAAAVIAAADKAVAAAKDAVTAAVTIFDAAVVDLDALVAAAPTKMEALEESQAEKVKELELATAKLQLAKRNVKPTSPDNDNTGVEEGKGPVSISTLAGKNITSIDVNAYRYNVLLWRAKCKEVTVNGKKIVKKDFPFNDFQEDGEASVACKDLPTTQYRFMPAYVLLHKSLNSEITKDVFVQDLLDNERGGLVNLKFTPEIFNTSKNSGSPTGIAGFLDFGVKIVEAPSAIDPKSTSYEGGGYLGVGVNFEFGIFDQQIASEDIVAGAAPAGAMAIGFGVYRNTISTGFDTGLFTTKIPTVYDTYALGYEYQINGLIAISGTRVIPTTVKAMDTLGSYSSLSVKYKY